MESSNPSYKIRIELDEVRPAIWRELIVPAHISLSWLHVVFQEAIGWMDCHLHQFSHGGCFYVMDMEEALEGEIDESSVALEQLLTNAGDQLTYEYDFGDGWTHSVRLVEILPPGDGDLLRCLKGEGACPPEDCGGPWGYMELLEAVEKEKKGQKLTEDERTQVEWYDANGGEDFEEEDIEDVNDTYCEILDVVLSSGGLGVGGAQVPPGGFYSDEMNDEEDARILDQIFAKAAAQDQDSAEERHSSLFSDPSEELDDLREPYSDLTADDINKFRASMECAAMVRAGEPWKSLSDCDIFGIEDPDSGAIDIVTALGEAKQIFSVQVHRAPYALSFWRKALLTPGAMNPDEFLQNSSMIEVGFANKAELDDPDFNLYEKVGFATPPRGRKRWFQFRTYRPRGYPWFPQADELTLLNRGAELCLRYVELMKASDDATSFLMEPDASAGLPPKLKVFRLTEGASPDQVENWDLADVGIDWDSCDLPSSTFEPNEFEVQQLANIKERDGLWELGAIFVPAPTMTENGPVMPILAIALDVRMQAPPQPHLSIDLDVSPTQSVWECLKDRALRENTLPKEIHVSTDASMATLRKFSEVSGVRIVKEKTLPLLSSLFKSMSGEM